MKKNKAQLMDLIYLIVIAFVTLMFFIVWVYGFDLLSDTMIGIDSGNPSVNISDASQQTFGQVNSAQTTGLHVLAFVMIFASALSILITNFLVKANPVFFIIYIFIIIVAIIVSVFVSNYYEDFMQDAVLGPTASDFTIASFMMLNLPIMIAVIGIFGAIFLFAGILRDAGLGGGIV